MTGYRKTQLANYTQKTCNIIDLTIISRRYIPGVLKDKRLKMVRKKYIPLQFLNSAKKKN